MEIREASIHPPCRSAGIWMGETLLVWSAARYGMEKTEKPADTMTGPFQNMTIPQASGIITKKIAAAYRYPAKHCGKQGVIPLHSNKSGRSYAHPTDQPAHGGERRFCAWKKKNFSLCKI